MSEPTGKELLDQVQAAKNASDKRFEELQQKLQDLGPHGYSKDSIVNIPGTLYADFINTVGHVKGTLEQMENVIGFLMDYTARMTVNLMEQHVVHIESNQATPHTELDKEDAEQRIQEVDGKA